MSYAPLSDYALEVAKGSIVGTSGVNKFGRNENIASGATEEIWDGSTAYSFPATALITSMSQTADQTALRGETIEIQGLNASWALVTQTKALDASLTTTVITLDTPLIRVFRAKVLSAVVIDSPVRIHNAGETVDYAVIGIGNNQTLMAIYTVPAASKAYMHNLGAAVNPATNLDPTSNPIKLWARDNANGYAPQIKHVFGLTAGLAGAEFSPYKAFGEKTDIWMTASPVGKAVDVSAGFDLYVVAD